MDDDWTSRATPAHTRPQLRKLLPDRRLPEGPVIPLTCQWLGCNEHYIPMIQYWRCRAETGYARNAGPADAARMLATPLRKSGVQELRPSPPAQHALGGSGRRCGMGRRYRHSARQIPLIKATSLPAAPARSGFGLPFHTLQQCQE